MSITYPPEMLPQGDGDSDEIVIIVGDEIYHLRDGRWTTDSGKFLPADEPRH